jgi:biotin carboxylase
MKQIILVGPFANFSSTAKELFEAAVSLGYEVIAIHHPKMQAPAGLLEKAKHVIELNADFENAATATEAYRKILDAGLRPVTVLPAIEFGVLLASRVGQLLGIPSNPVSVAETLRNKVRQREQLRAAGHFSPQFYAFRTYEELAREVKQFKFPVVLKPANGAGKVSVSKFYDADTLLASFREIEIMSRITSKFECVDMSRLWILEEFMEGEKITLELIAANANDILPLAITESTMIGDHFIEVGHALPAELSSELEARVKELGVKVLKDLKVSHGVVHLELLLNRKTQQLAVIETNGRMPGGKLPTLVEKASGNSYFELVLTAAATGKLPTIQPFQKAAAVHWFCREAGRVNTIVGFDEIERVPGFEEKYISVHVGDVSSPSSDGFDRIGYSMNTAATVREAKALAAQAAAKVQISYAKNDIHAG